MKEKENNILAKSLTAVGTSVLSVAANSICMIIFYQPKQPETVKKFRKF